MTNSIADIRIPDSKLAQEATQLIRDTEPPLLFHHSTRVYLWGALAGIRKNLKFDPELLYIGALFHDIGLTKQYSSATERFEVDGANAARTFLKQHGVPETSIDVVWDTIALHTTPGIPQHKKPEVALVTQGWKWMSSVSTMMDFLILNARRSWPHTRGETISKRK